MNLDELKIGEKFSGILQIRNVSLRETRGGDPYIFLKAGNISGDIMVKIWSVNKELADILVDGTVGGFVKLKDLLIGEYNGNKELVSRGGQDIEYVSRDDMDLDPDFKIQDYTIGAPFKKKDMISSILEDIELEIENREVRLVVSNLLDKHYEKFINHPAAISIHHDYEQGLLFHTYNMMEVGKALCEFYPFINKSLLLAGIVLHDLGKVIEYIVDEDTGGYAFSTRGNLLGHISIMSAEIEKEGRKLGVSEEVIMNLQHLVLSHHGNLEWGSPVLPQTPEALMLHAIDNLDSKMEQVRSALSGLKKGSHSNRIFGLGNIDLYYPKVEDGHKSENEIAIEQNIFDNL